MEFLRLLCNLYIIGLTVVLPLYTGGTYLQLGDTKYMVFRNLSLLCLGLWLAVSVFEKVRGRRYPGAAGDFAERSCPAAPSCEKGSDGKGTERALNATDICVLLYGASVLLSALLSRYKGTAWTGYIEWYMGAFSQLMFVGIYFFVSRCYDGRKFPLYFWTAAFLAVTLFGILHRLGFAPLGLMRGITIDDWEYSHMLSTIGNINWFCGYCSVALALPLGEYMRTESGWKRVLLYFVSVSGVFLLFIQGSDMGIAIMAAGLLVCLLWGVRDEIVCRRTFALMAAVCFLIPGYGMLASFLGRDAVKALPPDSVGWNVINHAAWWPAGMGCLVLWLLLWRISGHGEERSRRYLRIRIAAAFCLGAAAGGIGLLVRQPTGEMWGSGRGTIWKLAFQGFLRSGWQQKLIGAGPDCFAEYIYSVFTGEELYFMNGRWAGAVFANAHNEWLNHLVNLGIMGTGCYLAIFISAARRYRQCLPVILAIAMYGVASMTGFQHCMSTPLLFLVLGIYRGRKNSIVVCSVDGMSGSE